MSIIKRVTVTKDSVTEVVRAITELVGKQVLIGIPDSTTSRDDEVSQEMTNATLGFIHENGSPAANIPARPFLVPGVEKVLEPATDRLKGAAQATLRGDTKKADQLLNDAGIIGMGGARSEIRYGDFEPLKPSTIRNRFRSRGAKSRRENEEVYLYLIRMGVHPAAAQSEAGIRPLINTAQLANSITFVVRQK
jgi:hypothetical protein